MILLFVVVWAIVIALNEVLFSAQPFTLTSLADAMPSTLMLSVFLSAAVYLAKKKIIDALKKGQPIDKRFVAELTPQVGHELNNMRRQMEGNEGEDPNASTDPNAANIHRARTANRRKFNPYTAAVEAASAPRNKARREAYQRAYENTIEDANLAKAQEGLAALDALGAAERKAKESQSTEGAAVPTTARKSSKSGAGSVSSSSSALSAGATSASASAATSTAASTTNSLSGAGAANGDTSKAAGAGNSGSSSKIPLKSSAFSSLAERQAQKEQSKQRRQEQIDALSAVSQEDKAKAAAQSKKALAKNKAEDKSKSDDRGVVSAAGNAVNANSASNASNEGNAASNASNASNAGNASGANAYAESKGLSDDKKSSASSRSNAVSAEGKQDKDGASIYQSKASAKQNSKVVRDTRSATGQAAQRASMGSRVSSFAERAAQQQHLASLQQEAQEQVPLSSLRNRDSSKPQAKSFFHRNHALAPTHTKLDTSALQRSRQPKQGAGLDTSALKRATLSPGAQANMEHAINPFIPPTYSESSNALGAGAFNVGGRMLNTSAQDHLGAGNSMLQRTGDVGVNAPQQGSNNISPWTSAAAMSTTMNNDTSMARGQVQRLNLADFQANARARALARAQAPKATMGSVANSRLAPSSLSRRNRRKDLTNNASTQGTRGVMGGRGSWNKGAFAHGGAEHNNGGLDNQNSRLIGASTLGLNNARTALPRETIPEDQASVHRVVTTSLKPQVGPHSDHIPKVRPSDVIADLQLSPKIRARAHGTNLRRNRDQLLQRGPNFINAAATTAATGSVGAVSSEPMTSSNAATNAQTDRIHAHRNIGTYDRMQKSATTSVPESTTYNDDDEDNKQHIEPKSEDDKS